MDENTMNGFFNNTLKVCVKYSQWETNNSIFNHIIGISMLALTILTQTCLFYTLYYL